MGERSKIESFLPHNSSSSKKSWSDEQVWRRFFAFINREQKPECNGTIPVSSTLGSCFAFHKRVLEQQSEGSPGGDLSPRFFCGLLAFAAFGLTKFWMRQLRREITLEASTGTVSCISAPGAKAGSSLNVTYFRILGSRCIMINQAPEGRRQGSPEGRNKLCLSWHSRSTKVSDVRGSSPFSTCSETQGLRRMPPQSFSSRNGFFHVPISAPTENRSRARSRGTPAYFTDHQLVGK
jgi:hypothetical protein